MDNPSSTAVILSICVPLLLGTVTFIILGVLVMRHHQHFREEMLRLRLEANERAARYDAFYGYDTFGRMARHAEGEDVESVSPRTRVDAGEDVRVGGMLRASSLPGERVRGGGDEELGLGVPETRPLLRRARRSSDLAARLIAADEEGESSTGRLEALS
jgi:hypothetical protein